jgi:DNA-binding transcriptional LysR family regulator
VDTAFPFWNAGAVLDLADLRAFARIADLGSVSAAAHALKAPKSSVSRSLARLERAVGAVLVERSTRRLRLTDAGALLRPHARRILNDVDEAETALGGFGGVPRGLLRVNATYAFAQGVLAPMLPPFLARHPEVRVALDIENRRIDPMAEEADLVIRLVSVREVCHALPSFLIMSRIDARSRKASAWSERFSQSLARRRHRLSHAKVRSTIQRFGSTTKPRAWSERLTISTSIFVMTLRSADWNCGPW